MWLLGLFFACAALATFLVERYAGGGDDPKLKDWAGKTLPPLKHHLEMAQALDKNRK
jgi:putative membrane protein